MSFDPARAVLKGPDQFPRFLTPEHGRPLKEAGLSPEEILIVFSRGEESRALLATQMSYHHVAQGTLAGEPYVVAF
ncbi:MAG: hypothetical protein ACE5ID_07380 [Acidobacteriota bacterium]